MAIDKRATRLGVLGLVGTLFFGLIGVRLWFLQTVKERCNRRSTPPSCAPCRCCPSAVGSSTSTAASSPTTSGCSPSPSTGSTAQATPTGLEIFRRLSGWIDVPIEDMEARFQSRHRQPVPADADRQRIDEPTATALPGALRGFPRCAHPHESRRVYPYAPLATHVVGYMGAITAETKDTYQDGRLLPQRAGRAVRRREEHGGRAPRHVGQVRSTRSTPPAAPCA